MIKSKRREKGCENPNASFDPDPSLTCLDETKLSVSGQFLLGLKEYFYTGVLPIVGPRPNWLIMEKP